MISLKNYASNKIILKINGCLTLELSIGSDKFSQLISIYNDSNIYRKILIDDSMNLIKKFSLLLHV